MRKIFYNADVVTMDEKNPSCEAIVVENGNIAYVGSNEGALALAEEGDEKIDLAGKALLPGFIDPHSHFSGAAYAYVQVNIGEAVCLEDIKNKITDHIKYNNVPKGKWINCTGYDHNALEEKTHPNKEWLDSFTEGYPVVLQHKSGHMGVFNSQGLEELGITADTPCPNGGMIGVDENGNTTGYMEETIYIDTVQAMPQPSPQEIFGGFIQGQTKYASYGITTLQEGYFLDMLSPLYQGLIAQNMLKLDVVAFMDFRNVDGLIEAYPGHLKEYKNHFKLGGIKMILDGSPQGRTAWMETPYADSEDYCGNGVMPDQYVEGVLKQGGAKNLQVLAHCNGDAAAAQYIRCMDNVAKEIPSVDDNRNVVIHGQLLREDQMDGVKRHNMVVSFFGAHVYHWGDIHMKNFGAERAAKISSIRSAIDKGIPYTFHQDTPVIEPNMLETLWIVTNRITKNGVELGADQKISTYEALKGITINGAYQYFEEDIKGSIEVGKYADLVVLDRNPLKVDTMELKDLIVEETFKNGESVYKRA